MSAQRKAYSVERIAYSGERVAFRTRLIPSSEKSRPHPAGCGKTLPWLKALGSRLKASTKRSTVAQAVPPSLPHRARSRNQFLSNLLASSLQPPAFSGFRNGQALIELMVFGSLLIMLLGVLINFGLNYQYNQQASMRAFREAMAIASTQRTASYTLLQDRHIPNPANPFAIGSFSPFSSSGSVVRTYQMQENPINDAALPRTRLAVQGLLGVMVEKNEVSCHPGELGCTMSGFRTITIKPDEIKIDKGRWSEDTKKVSPLDKYIEIYGGNAICMKTDCGSKLITDNKGKPIRFELRMVDPCMGELLSLDGCKRIALQILNLPAPGTSGDTYCSRECNRGRALVAPKDLPKDLPSCTDICKQSIEIPWYAQRTGGQFLALNNMFGGAKAMSIQPGSVKSSKVDNRLTKTETSSAISTTASVKWSDQTTRTMLSRDRDKNVAVSIPIVSQAGDKASKTVTWTTPWQR